MRDAPNGAHAHDVVIMSANSSLEEVQAELAKLKIAYEVLEKSHRRLIAKDLIAGWGT